MTQMALRIAELASFSLMPSAARIAESASVGTLLCTSSLSPLAACAATLLAALLAAAFDTLDSDSDYTTLAGPLLSYAACLCGLLRPIPWQILRFGRGGCLLKVPGGFPHA